jgi:hypothetical protein
VAGAGQAGLAYELLMCGIAGTICLTGAPHRLLRWSQSLIGGDTMVELKRIYRTRQALRLIMLSAAVWLFAGSS